MIVSTKTRYDGFAKAIGMLVLTTPHGLGHAKIVVVVDAEVDPFDLKQVMWAMSSRSIQRATLLSYRTFR